MIIWLVEHYRVFDKCNIDYYTIFRSFFSFLSAFLIFFGGGSYFISFLKKLNVYEVIRDTGPTIHYIKQGTPTMGGIMIIFAIVFSVLLWANLCNRYVWYVIFILVSYGIIGWIDDYHKVFRKYARGLNVSLKFFLLSVVALFLIILIFIVEKDVTGIQLFFPGFKNITLHLGGWYIFLGYLIIVGISNSVNLSDGLDGLVIFPIVCISFGLGLIALMASDLYFANYIGIQYFPLFRELVIVCGAIIGSGLGFLWFNAYPAQVFMGDVGALSLGGALGVIAVLLHQEILLLIMGALFVLETLSVIFQVYFLRFYRRRIFLMAPIHHHFELKGEPESRIVIRFWIITLILVLISLMMLKVY